ncbi:MAG: hypothetical protein ACXWLD_12325 [Rhizomicrobium sp.]|jgi:uncharacterized membrane protein HdeD (DUF308 family)
MMRGILIAIGVVALLCGLIALATGAFPPAAILGVWGILLLIGTVFERVTYKATHAAPPGAGWVRTAERFVDEATGKHITVYIEPKTGERQYVQE